MKPLVSVVSRDKKHKTEAVVALVGEFRKRGYRVATVKHHQHDDFDMDVPGKPSYRHREAGAEEVVVASPTMLAYIRRHDREPSLEEAASIFSDQIDIIICEGYSSADTLKIEAPINRVSEAVDMIEERLDIHPKMLRDYDH